MKKTVILLALSILLTGCAKTERAPANASQEATESVSADSAVITEATEQTENTTPPAEQTENTEPTSEPSTPETESQPKCAEQERLEQVILAAVTQEDSNTLLGEVFGDLDGDGTDELFALYGNTDGYYKNSVVGELYFASGDSAEKLLELNEYTSPHTFIAEGDILYTAEEQYATGSISRVFAVRGSKAVPVRFDFAADMMIQHLDGNEFVAFHSTYDMTEGMGHTWKPYWYYYSREETAFIPFSAHEITPEQFMEYDGAEQALEIIKNAGGDEYTLLLFDNGIVAANFVVEYVNRHFTWRISDGRLIDVNESEGKNPSEGIYLIPQDYHK